MNFDVLLVTYYKDKPEFLMEAIRSVYDDQTMKPSGIVLVVNGPLHQSHEVVIRHWLLKLGEAVFKVIRLDKNHGLGHALNQGLAFCSSNWVARMDSDDISLPQRFELQTQFLQKYPEILLVGGAIQPFYTSESGEEIEQESLRPLSYPADSKAIKEFVCRGSPFAHPSVFIHKNLLLHYPYKSNLFHARTGSGNEDIDLWFRLVQDKIPMANIPEVVLKFRMTAHFFARRSVSKSLSEFRIYVNGILRLFGFSWRLFFPISRLIMRLSPDFVSRMLYRWRNQIYRV